MGQSRRLKSCKQEPDILFEDPHLMILSKPAGMLSQGDVSESASVVDWLRKYWGRPYVGLVHRLDRNTSGVMVVAKRTKAASRLTEALQEGKILRTYLAWLKGELLEPQVWKHWLLKNEKTNQVTVVREGLQGAKAALLNVKPVRRIRTQKGVLTLAEFVLDTGRSHQIRVQSKTMGHPVLGDPKYGDEKLNRQLPMDRPALHSHRIELPHPMSGEILRVEADLPEDFIKIGSLK